MLTLLSEKQFHNKFLDYTGLRDHKPIELLINPVPFTSDPLQLLGWKYTLKCIGKSRRNVSAKGWPKLESLEEKHSKQLEEKII